MARLNSERRKSTLVAALALSLIFLIATPDQLIGESEMADAIKQHQRAKIEAWLGSQEPNMESESLAELARAILAASERNALDPVLLLAIIQVESGFDHKAVSPRGAQGLMQVKPVVVKALIEGGKLHPEQRHRNLTNPLVNVQIGASYLAHLNEMFGDLKTALIAYNWGPTRVRQKIEAKQDIPLGYVTRVLSAQRTVEQQLALSETLRAKPDNSTSVVAGG